MEKNKINSSLLKEEAFRPKSFNVIIEDGQFARPSETASDAKNYWTKRLVFDKSPFPVRSERKDGRLRRHGRDEGNSWHHTQFVAHSLYFDEFVANRRKFGPRVPNYSYPS